MPTDLYAHVTSASVMGAPHLRRIHEQEHLHLLVLLMHLLLTRLEPGLRCGLHVKRDVLHLLEHRVDQAVAKPQHPGALAHTLVELKGLPLLRQRHPGFEVPEDGGGLLLQKVVGGCLHSLSLSGGVVEVLLLRAYQRCPQLRHERLAQGGIA